MIRKKAAPPRERITAEARNLFEIAYLSREQVSRFRSDFREVASYFVQMRETGEYVPSSDRMEHIQSVLQLLNVMDKDHRFEMAVNQENGAKEVRTMSEWLTRVINESEAKGVAQGVEKGRMEGSLEVLAGLVKDGLLPVTEAAKRAGMTVAEFGKRTGIAVQ